MSARGEAPDFHAKLLLRNNPLYHPEEVLPKYQTPGQKTAQSIRRQAGAEGEQTTVHVANLSNPGSPIAKKVQPQQSMSGRLEDIRQVEYLDPASSCGNSPDLYERF